MEIRPFIKTIKIDTPVFIHKGEDHSVMSYRFCHPDDNLKAWKKYLEKMYYQGINKCFLYQMEHKIDRLWKNYRDLGNKEEIELGTLWVRCKFLE